MFGKRQKGERDEQIEEPVGRSGHRIAHGTCPQWIQFGVDRPRHRAQSGRKRYEIKTEAGYRKHRVGGRTPTIAPRPRSRRAVRTPSSVQRSIVIDRIDRKTTRRICRVRLIVTVATVRPSDTSRTIRLKRTSVGQWRGERGDANLHLISVQRSKSNNVQPKSFNLIKSELN